MAASTPSPVSPQETKPWAFLGGDELEPDDPWAGMSDDGASAEGGAWEDLSDDEIPENDPVEDAGRGGVADEVVAEEAAALEDDHGHGMSDVFLHGGRRRPRVATLLARVDQNISDYMALLADAKVVERGVARPAPIADEGPVPVAEGVLPDPPPPALAIANYTSRFLPLVPVAATHAPIARAFEQFAPIMACAQDGKVNAPRIVADESETRVLKHFLAEKRTTESLATEASLLNATPYVVGRLRTLAACAAVTMHAHSTVKLIGAIARENARAGGRALALIERYKGDEAQFKLTVADQEGCGPRSGAAISGAVAVPSQQLALLTKQSAMTRVLQSHRKLAALFQKADSSFFAVQVDVPIPLQIMSSTKMDVYALCYAQQRLPLEDVSALFEQSYTLHLADGDGAIGAALRGAAAHDDASTIWWRHRCDIHKLSHIAEAPMENPSMQFHVTGLVNFALSLSSANVMREFREALRVVLVGRLVYKRGRPRAADLERNTAIATLCILGDSRTSVLRRAIILQVLNGNWEHDRVEHVCWGVAQTKLIACRRSCLWSLRASLLRARPSSPGKSGQALTWPCRSHYCSP